MRVRPRLTHSQDRRAERVCTGALRAEHARWRQRAAPAPPALGVPGLAAAVAGPRRVALRVALGAGAPCGAAARAHGAAWCGFRARTLARACGVRRGAGRARTDAGVVRRGAQLRHHNHDPRAGSHTSMTRHARLETTFMTARARHCRAGIVCTNSAYVLVLFVGTLIMEPTRALALARKTISRNDFDCVDRHRRHYWVHTRRFSIRSVLVIAGSSWPSGDGTHALALRFHRRH
jgi:hypothetical protein